MAECRRLAELLHLDAVGLVRRVGGRRRIAWWASPETELLPLDRILEGPPPVGSPVPRATTSCSRT